MTFAADRQIQDGERELRVIRRQALGFLPQQAPFQPLDLLLQNEDELLVFVALALELLDAKRVRSLEGAQSLFEGCPCRFAHGMNECKILRSLSSGARLRTTLLAAFGLWHASEQLG